jgi:hypothetical protein
MSVSLIYNQTIHTLNNPKTAKACFRVLIRNCLCHPFACIIDGRVLTPMSTNYFIKIMSSYCDTIAIGDILYRYKLIQSQLSTNRFASARASESALLYTHWVGNSLMIVANDWTLNLTTFYWRQIYSILQLSCFAIYWTESIPRHSGHMNRKSHLPHAKKVWSK